MHIATSALLCAAFAALASVASLPAQAQVTHWCSYLGGTADQESIEAVTVAANGDVLVAGWTRSSDFPVTPGCFDATRDGVEDVIVARLSPDGSQVLAATFLGGTAKDEAVFVEEAPDGTIWVGGSTASSTFPTTADAYAAPAGNSDAFLVQLDANLTSVLYGTTFGGRFRDTGEAFVLDHANGRIWIAGYADGTLPTTAGGYQRTSTVGDWFLAVLDRSAPGSTTLAYGTLLGGNSIEGRVDGLSVDANGIVTMTARAVSSDLPTTAGAFQTAQSGGSGYLARFDPSLQGAASLVYASYFGGNGSELSFRHAPGAGGVLHLVLSSTSSDLPLTPNAAITTRGLNADVYYARFDPTASGSAALQYGSWLLATNNGEEASAVDYAGGELAVFYWTNGPQPGSTGALMPGWSWRTQYHGYVQVLDVTSQAVPSVRYASHYEGCVNGNFPRAMAFDGAEVVLAGYGEAPATPGVAQIRPTSLFDAFVGRLGLGAWPASFESFGSSCTGTAGTPVLEGTVRARLCGNLEMRASSLKPFTTALLIGGLSRTTWSGLPLPMPLDSLGAPGCAVHAEILATMNRATGSTGAVTVSIPIPSDPFLVGSSAYFQFAVFDSAANSFGLVTTNGLRAEVRW